MWINLDKEDFEQRLAIDPATAIAYVRSRIAHYARDPIDEKYIAAVPISEGDLECDSDAVVSVGDDLGAYVMCWKWVYDEDAGVERETEDV